MHHRGENLLKCSSVESPSLSLYCVQCWPGSAGLDTGLAVASDKLVTSQNMQAHDTLETEQSHFPWNRIGCIIPDPEQLLSFS